MSSVAALSGLAKQAGSVLRSVGSVSDEATRLLGKTDRVATSLFPQVRAGLASANLAGARSLVHSGDDLAKLLARSGDDGAVVARDVLAPQLDGVLRLLRPMGSNIHAARNVIGANTRWADDAITSVHRLSDQAAGGVLPSAGAFDDALLSLRRLDTSLARLPVRGTVASGDAARVLAETVVGTQLKEAAGALRHLTSRTAGAQAAIGARVNLADDAARQLGSVVDTARSGRVPGAAQLAEAQRGVRALNFQLGVAG